MQYKCPQCEKFFRNKALLNRHVSRIHSDLAVKSNEPDQSKPNETEYSSPGKTLELAVKTKPEQEETPEPQGYHCIDCGGSVSKGQNRCPSCGARLDWSQV